MTETYLDQLVHELRQRDVPGQRIGEVIAEVQAHLAESGDTPGEAFGPASEYAETVSAAIRPPAGDARLWPKVRNVVVYWLSGVGGLLLAAGVGALTTREPVHVTLGWVLAAAIMPPAATWLVALIGRSDVAHRQIWLAGSAVGAVLLALLLLVDRPVLLTLHSVAALGTGLALLAVGLFGVKRDPVVDPLTGADRYPLSRRARLLLLAVFLAPIAVLVAVSFLVR